MSTSVLTVSSKGQIVLPARVRKELAIINGDHLALYTSGDVIMLKKIDMPNADDFEQRLDEAKDWAESVGYKESDVDSIIADVRSRKRAAS